MEDIRPNKIADFDVRFTNNHICKLKVLLSFLPPSMQSNFAIYIKYIELQYTMQYFRSPGYRNNRCNTASAQPIDFSCICDELFPYCSEQEKQQFNQIRNIFQTMRSMQDMMEMMETMKQLFPEGMGNGDGEQNGFGPDMLAAMSSMFGGGMDLSAMSEMFSGGI
ncbi:MAG: hypothetical protein IJ379_07370 [Lachnospiraceae bacterium]|nr:hypothetical protein [Lachnospiraceae bacterium]